MAQLLDRLPLSIQFHLLPAKRNFGAEEILLDEQIEEPGCAIDDPLIELIDLSRVIPWRAVGAIEDNQASRQELLVADDDLNLEEVGGVLG